mmetsp:Transcript_39499/g.66322  ORF Transcript_39499/g.66322 Transcript_39499/m.66322 type:complete len:226 (-) Transcript_39499:310-987(-)
MTSERPPRTATVLRIFFSSLLGLATCALRLICTRCLRVVVQDNACASSGRGRLRFREFASDLVEQLVHIHRRLGGGFHKEEAVLVRVSLRLLGGHLPLFLLVSLVARQRHHQARVALPLQLPHPALRAVEGLHRGQVVHYDGRRCASVVHGCKRVIPFLASSIPDFELDSGVVDGHSLCKEGSADGGFLVLEELPLDEAQHQAGLAGAHIAKKNQFSLHWRICAE